VDFHGVACAASWKQSADFLHVYTEGDKCSAEKNASKRFCSARDISIKRQRARGMSSSSCREVDGGGAVHHRNLALQQLLHAPMSNCAGRVSGRDQILVQQGNAVQPNQLGCAKGCRYYSPGHLRSEVHHLATEVACCPYFLPQKRFHLHANEMHVHQATTS
jgi:hypothetical protein